MAERAWKILVVDDEQNIRITLFEALSRNGYDVVAATDGLMALDIYDKHKIDLVITDIKMPKMDGLELLHRLKRKNPELPVIIITGYATVDTAIAAMKRGAFDYILKPFSVEVIKNSVKRVFTAIETAPIIEKIFHKKITTKPTKPIIGQNDQIVRLMQRAKSVASSKATIMILGESGTGKELFARYLHNEGNRANGPFVALNCAALPDSLLESELFGYEKGAFTGAITSKKGKFELADGGTLLLDEISEIPFHLQAKLLRVLQEEEVDRLGGKTPVKIDVHIVTTSNRDLEQAVREQTFRADLYYRINVIPLRLPSLRERQDDILPLTNYFNKKYSQQYNKTFKKLSRSSLKRFMNYAWPGNVREMENFIERAVLLSTSRELEPWDFWDDIEAPPDTTLSPEPDPTVKINHTNTPSKTCHNSQTNAEILNLKEMERQMIIQALGKTDNNRTHAARMLGISVRTLRNKLHEYRNQGLIK